MDQFDNVHKCIFSNDFILHIYQDGFRRTIWWDSKISLLKSLLWPGKIFFWMINFHSPPINCLFSPNLWIDIHQKCLFPAFWCLPMCHILAKANVQYKVKYKLELRGVTTSKTHRFWPICFLPIYGQFCYFSWFFFPFLSFSLLFFFLLRILGGTSPYPLTENFRGTHPLLLLPVVCGNSV